MDVLKDVLSLAAAVIATITALLGLYGKIVDLQQRRAKQLQRDAKPTPRVPRQLPVSPKKDVAEPEDQPAVDVEQDVDSTRNARARQLVRTPAIALLAAAFLGLASSLLGTAVSVVQINHEGEFGIIRLVVFISFSLASAVAVWAGFNMIKLQSYWLCMAGSFAAMPGGWFCSLVGIPVGIWSVVTLLKPEVRSAFEQKCDQDSARGG